MERPEILNKIIEKKGYTKYLEIGIDDPELCFNHVKCEKKIGIDPYNDKLGTHIWNKKNLKKIKESIEVSDSSQWFEMTSDEFFQKRRDKFDIIFIDGLHMEDQVDKDIENSLKRLRKGGLIVLHDTHPQAEAVQSASPVSGTPWMGQVYRSFWKLRMQRDDLDLCTVFEHTGFSFIRPGKNVKYEKPNFKGNMSFMYFKLHKKEIMNVVTLNKFFDLWL